MPGNVIHAVVHAKYRRPLRPGERPFRGDVINASILVGGLHADNHDQDLDRRNDKCRLIGERLDLQPGMRSNEVGCGWGGLACYLAENYRVHVDAITIVNNSMVPLPVSKNADLKTKSTFTCGLSRPRRQLGPRRFD